jgi:probable O-glycosylation ligase (exosortase A-associated)
LLLRVIALSLGFYGLKGGIFAIVTGGNYIVWGPENSFLEANNTIGLALNMNIPVLLYLLKIETHPWLRWMMRAMLLLSYPAIICTYSRGAWVGLGLITALMFFKSKYKFRLAVVVGALGVMLIPFLIQLAPQRLIDRYYELVNYEEEESAQSRFLAWQLCGRVGLAHPFNGGGFDFYSNEIYAEYIPEGMEAWLEKWKASAKAWSCHSIWLTMLGEHGLPGFAFWVGLIGSCLLSLQRMRSYAKAHAELSWIHHYVDAVQTALIAFIIVGTFLDAAYFDMFYYLVAVIIIIKQRILDTTTEVALTEAVPAIDKPHAVAAKRASPG